MTARAFPSSQAQRGAGCAKSNGNSSASACAELSPSSSDDRERQYSTACSTHKGAAPDVSSGVKSGRNPATRSEGEMHVQEPVDAVGGELALTRCGECGPGGRGRQHRHLLTERPRRPHAARRTERPRAGPRARPRARPDHHPERRQRSAWPSHSPSRWVATSTVLPVAACARRCCWSARLPVGIEAEARLVEHQDAGVGQIQHREAEPLPRAARQAAGGDCRYRPSPHARCTCRPRAAGRPRRRA